MARNDGTNRTIARNERYQRKDVLNMERHNERKNETYKNEDVLLKFKDKNFYFKKPTDTYLGIYDKMCEDEIIFERGLKKDAHIIDELVFDVNTTYFEKNGGYDYAKDFFTKAYEYAIEKVGGEQYILSAVMHADERHKELSKELEKDVFHYHLHVVYVPVVKKEILWTKRTKKVELRGTVKDVIMQVSDSKKWKSYLPDEVTGKPTRDLSYSILQDEFFEHMQKCGYNDIERGEKGANEEHLSVTEFKVMKEEERLKSTVKRVQETETIIDKQTDAINSNSYKIKSQEKQLDSIEKSKTKIKRVDDIESKPAIFDKNKILVDKSDFEDIKILAQKQFVSSSNEKHLKAQIKELQEENRIQSSELYQYKSLKNKLDFGKIQAENSNLKNLVNKLMRFLDLVGLKEKAENYLKQNKDKER